MVSLDMARIFLFPLWISFPYNLLGKKPSCALVKKTNVFIVHKM